MEGKKRNKTDEDKGKFARLRKRNEKETKIEGGVWITDDKKLIDSRFFQQSSIYEIGKWHLKFIGQKSIYTM